MSVKPFIKPRPANPPAGTVTAGAPRISTNELTIFSVAASVADPAERAAYLERACGNNAGMRSRLEERLSARARSAAPTPNTPAIAAPSELARTARDTAFSGNDRPDALALVPMSAAQFAAAQQSPRHSPIPWAAATILAIAVGALAVFFYMERKTREGAEQETQIALRDRSEAERAREAAAATALEARTIAERTEQARQSALQEKEAAATEAAKAKAEAAQQRTEREQALAALKQANEKAQAAEAEVAKLRAETVAGQRANELALADSLARLGAAQMDARAYNEAETNLRQALQLRMQLKADAWSIVENRALLGSVLMQRSQNDAALQEIQSAAEAIEALGAPATDADRARAAAASKRIVHYFTVTGRRKDATEWRRRLDAVVAAR